MVRSPFQSSCGPGVCRGFSWEVLPEVWGRVLVARNEFQLSYPPGDMLCPASRLGWYPEPFWMNFNPRTGWLRFQSSCVCMMGSSGISSKFQSAPFVVQAGSACTLGSDILCCPHVLSAGFSGDSSAVSILMPFVNRSGLRFNPDAAGVCAGALPGGVLPWARFWSHEMSFNPHALPLGMCCVQPSVLAGPQNGSGGVSTLTLAGSGFNPRACWSGGLRACAVSVRRRVSNDAVSILIQPGVGCRFNSHPGVPGCASRPCCFWGNVSFNPRPCREMGGAGPDSFNPHPHAAGRLGHWPQAVRPELPLQFQFSSFWMQSVSFCPHRVPYGFQSSRVPAGFSRAACVSFNSDVGLQQPGRSMSLGFQCISGSVPPRDIMFQSSRLGWVLRWGHGFGYCHSCVQRFSTLACSKRVCGLDWAYINWVSILGCSPVVRRRYDLVASAMGGLQASCAPSGWAAPRMNRG